MWRHQGWACQWAQNSYTWLKYAPAGLDSRRDHISRHLLRLISTNAAYRLRVALCDQDRGLRMQTDQIRLWKILSYCAILDKFIKCNCLCSGSYLRTLLWRRLRHFQNQGGQVKAFFCIGGHSFHVWPRWKYPYRSNEWPDSGELAH